MSALALIAPLPFSTAAAAAATGHEHKAFVHVYAAQFSDNRFLEVVRFDVDLDDSWLAAVGLGRRFDRIGDRAQWEWELNAAQHWGMQHHRELNAFLALRWLRFPWDAHLDTTAAFGFGMSYASRTPRIEVDDEGRAARILFFLSAELTAAPRAWKQWSVLLRVHHRSGAFGLIDDAGSSNFAGLGVRRHFDW